MHLRLLRRLLLLRLPRPLLLLRLLQLLLLLRLLQLLLLLRLPRPLQPSRLIGIRLSLCRRPLLTILDHCLAL
jgi:hypothetical protein